MADLIRHMEEGHETADIDGVIDEVAEARGTYDSLDERLDAMGDAPSPSSSTPVMDGTGSAGTANTFARGDHEHPHDTTKQDTLAFEGTYNASTNKAATMSAVKDGKLTGYAQASGNVAATDKIIEAIGKVEKKADDNKANILTVADQSTQYNIVPIKSVISTGDASVAATVAEDKTITITITGTTSSAIGFEISDNFVIDTTAQYVMTGNPSAGAIRLILQQAESPYNWIQQQYNNQAATATSSISLVRYYVYIYANSSGTITLKPMLIPKAVYDAGFTDYQPYALSNVELTEKSANTANVIKSNFNATDWTKVDELSFEIPAGKTVQYVASATRDTTVQCLGIAFVRSDTFSYDNALAITENPNSLNYFMLSCAGIRSRLGGTAETVNVFVKYSGQASTSITRTYSFV